VPVRKAISAALLVLAVATIPLTTPMAEAQKPDIQGWWWMYTQLPLPVDPKPLVPQFPELPDTPPPPTVPEDGLYVAATPAGIEAIAALSFVIPEGASAPTLTLTPSTPLAPTTSIRLCQVNSTWRPVQAGRWASKPLYACAADAPLGVVPTDGSKITWKLGKLGQSQLVDVALVPAENAAVTANFVKPDAKVLEVVAGATADVSSAIGTGSGVLGSTTEPNSLNAALTDPSFGPTLAPYLQPGQDQTIGAAPTGGQAIQDLAAAPTVQIVEKRDNIENFGFFGLIVLAALFSRYRSTPVREPRSLVNFGRHEEDDE
jgi:hypothetical protein